MSFYNLQTILDAAAAEFGKCLPLTELSTAAYANMRYPKILPLMRFRVRRYAAEGFGNLFSMYTRACAGLMQLATFVCTPNCATSMPLMLVDVMALDGKRAVFVEYYDLTDKGASCVGLEAVAKRFADLPDYEETQAWYVERRTPYSLIKGGANEARLLAMLKESIAAYADACACQTEQRPENLLKLADFIDQMATRGNPSSATLKKLLGSDGAERFYRTLVMPATFTTTNKL